jgi:hypothetical protein
MYAFMTERRQLAIASSAQIQGPYGKIVLTACVLAAKGD